MLIVAKGKLLSIFTKIMIVYDSNNTLLRRRNENFCKMPKSFRLEFDKKFKKSSI